MSLKTRYLEVGTISLFFFFNDCLQIFCEQRADIEFLNRLSSCSPSIFFQIYGFHFSITFTSNDSRAIEKFNHLLRIMIVPIDSLNNGPRDSL